MAGAPLYVEEEKHVDFLELVKDSVSTTSRGTLLGREVVEESFDGHVYRVVMRATFRPVDPKNDFEETERLPAVDESAATGASNDTQQVPPADDARVTTSGAGKQTDETTPAITRSVATPMAVASGRPAEIRESPSTTSSSTLD